MGRLAAATLLVSLFAAVPCGAQQNEPYVAPATNTPAGAATSGFALALAVDQSKVPFDYPGMGTIIWVTMEIRNVSGTTMHANVFARSLYQFFNSAYQFTVINTRTGALVPTNPKASFSRDSVGGPGVGRALSPNTSIFLKFRLDDLYNFSEPGIYSVRVTTAPLIVSGHLVSLPPSNPVTIDLYQRQGIP
jgi:hypothetical protein